jgi:putative membrane protein
MDRLIEKYLSRSDFTKIEDAVREAEKKTSGEIVPYIVARSDDYDEAEWRGGFLLGAVTLVALDLMYEFATGWIPATPTIIGLAALLAGAIGFLVVKFLAALKRLLAGASQIERRVAQRASEAFLAEEVFRTRDRTGILLFVSLMEHRVVVLGDAGINAKVDQSAWHDLVQRIVRGIRDGRTADGLLSAIDECGTLLARHGVAIRSDDTNELPNTLRKG